MVRRGSSWFVAGKMLPKSPPRVQNPKKKVFFGLFAVREVLGIPRSPIFMERFGVSRNTFLPYEI
jgi:hypothetical protein